jgi:hypothetical protein
MTDRVKAAIILGSAIIIATLLWIYFSPYQTCVRAERVQGSSGAEWRCTMAIGGT